LASNVALSSVFLQDVGNGATPAFTHQGGNVWKLANWQVPALTDDTTFQLRATVEIDSSGQVIANTPCTTPNATGSLNFDSTVPTAAVDGITYADQNYSAIKAGDTGYFDVTLSADILATPANFVGSYIATKLGWVNGSDALTYKGTSTSLAAQPFKVYSSNVGEDVSSPVSYQVFKISNGTFTSRVYSTVLINDNDTLVTNVHMNTNTNVNWTGAGFSESYNVLTTMSPTLTFTTNDTILNVQNLVVSGTGLSINGPNFNSGTSEFTATFIFNNATGV